MSDCRIINSIKNSTVSTVNHLTHNVHKSPFTFLFKKTPPPIQKCLFFHMLSTEFVFEEDAF